MLIFKNAGLNRPPPPSLVGKTCLRGGGVVGSFLTVAVLSHLIIESPHKHIGPLPCHHCFTIPRHPISQFNSFFHRSHPVTPPVSEYMRVMIFSLLKKKYVKWIYFLNSAIFEPDFLSLSSTAWISLPCQRYYRTTSLQAGDSIIE